MSHRGLRAGAGAPGIEPAPLGLPLFPGPLPPAAGAGETLEMLPLAVGAGSAWAGPGRTASRPWAQERRLTVLAQEGEGSRGRDRARPRTHAEPTAARSGK